MSSSAAADLWDAIARDAVAESSLWGDALQPEPAAATSRCSRRSPRSASRSGSRRSTRATSCTTATPRLFAPADADTALLLGDYLYAHGLVRVAGLRRGRRGRRPLRADLALQPAARRGCRRRRPALGRDRRAARHRPRARRAAGGAPPARRRVSALERAARAAAGDEPVERALAAHARPACGRFSPMLASSSPRPPPRKARRPSSSMLVVGLVFLSVIALGELTHWLRHRR